MKNFVSLTLFLFAHGLSAQPQLLYSHGDTLYVWESTQAVLRSGPSIDSPAIAHLPYGMTVTTRIDAPNTDGPDRIVLRDSFAHPFKNSRSYRPQNRWAKVQWRSYEGYLPDVYLSKLPPVQPDDYVPAPENRVLIERYATRAFGRPQQIRKELPDFDAPGRDSKRRAEQCIYPNGIHTINIRSMHFATWQLLLPDATLNEGFLLARVLFPHIAAGVEPVILEVSDDENLWFYISDEGGQRLRIQVLGNFVSIMTLYAD